MNSVKPQLIVKRMRRYFILGAFLCVTSLMKAQLYAPTLYDLDKVLVASGQYDK